MRWRYAQRGREGKSRLLDELCEVCDYDRKYAIKLLGDKPAATRNKVGRKPVYAKEVVAVIKPIWLSSEQPCGKRLKELLPICAHCTTRQTHASVTAAQSSHAIPNPARW